MSKNRKLTELKNIGKKNFSRLIEVGVFSEDELRAIGAAEAYRRVKKRFIPIKRTLFHVSRIFLV
jgi:DNA transformation protein and related proteins